MERSGALVTRDLKAVEPEHGPIASRAYRLALKSRRLKALHLLERGYFGFALVPDGLVVGDMCIAFRRRRAIRDKNRKKTIACAAGFHGADRVVRLRQMHTFGSPWDGADRFRPMVRLVRHLPSQPGDGL